MQNPDNENSDPGSGTESSLEQEEASEPNDSDKQGCVSDLIRWKDVGLKGTFFAVRCRSSRIGSYRVSPTDRVLFSSEGIMLEVPTLTASGVASTTPVKLVITSREILRMDVHFGKSMPVFFLYVSPSAARSVREKLQMNKNGGPYLDVQSGDESQRRITLLPVELNDAAKSAIKQAFSPGAVFREISQDDANKFLVISSPTDVREMLDRLPSSTTATAESVIASPARASMANKENGGKVEVSIRCLMNDE